MNYAVIGLGFGDEGKGKVVSSLCERLGSVNVQRFSGGQQAGHMVHVGDNRHVFSNFGSGTLQGAGTYWGKTCTFDPVGFLNELEILEKIANPIFAMHPYCPITTPLDKEANLLHEKKHKHGTVGVGVGATWDREEHFYQLHMGDLLSRFIFKNKLLKIGEYYGRPDFDWTNFTDTCYSALECMESLGEVKERTNVIYEGSQGLMLDPSIGFFPNVTRSALLPSDASIHEYYLVTRAYCTRHGAGPMPNEGLELNVLENETETNVFGTQGNFRKSVLDLDVLNYAIDKVPNHFSSLVITCLDQMQDYPLTVNGELFRYDNESEFIQKVRKELFNIDTIYLSRSDCTKMERVV